MLTDYAGEENIAPLPLLPTPLLLRPRRLYLLQVELLVQEKWIEHRTCYDAFGQKTGLKSKVKKDKVTKICHLRLSLRRELLS